MEANQTSGWIKRHTVLPVMFADGVLCWKWMIDGATQDTATSLKELIERIKEMELSDGYKVRVENEQNGFAVWVK